MNEPGHIYSQCTRLLVIFLSFMVGRIVLYSSLTFLFTSTSSIQSAFRNLHVNKSVFELKVVKFATKKRWGIPSSRGKREKAVGNYWDWEVEKKSGNWGDEIPSWRMKWCESLLHKERKKVYIKLLVCLVNIQSFIVGR